MTTTNALKLALQSLPAVLVLIGHIFCNFFRHYWDEDVKMNVKLSVTCLLYTNDFVSESNFVGSWLEIRNDST